MTCLRKTLPYKEAAKLLVPNLARRFFNLNGVQNVVDSLRDLNSLARSYPPTE